MKQNNFKLSISKMHLPKTRLKSMNFEIQSPGKTKKVANRQGEWT